jgi:hypothetical protein
MVALRIAYIDSRIFCTSHIPVQVMFLKGPIGSSVMHSPHSFFSVLSAQNRDQKNCKNSPSASPHHEK